MLLPYSASDKRRSMFWALLCVAVLALAVFILLGLIRAHGASLFAPWLIGCSLIAVVLLCVWGAVYIREEPGFVRGVLIGGAGFFLLLTVLVLWAALAPPRGDTKQMLVRAEIQSIRTMLSCFRGPTGSFPSTDQGLNALVPRLLEELPKDRWGSPYVYRCPGTKNPNSYDLFSAGPDRLPDTADDEWGQ